MGLILVFLALQPAFAEVPGDAGGGATDPNLQVVTQAALGKTGEVIGGGTLSRIEVHPEFQRYYLQWPDGTGIAVEITAWDREHVGLCKSDALTIFPRPELQLPMKDRANAAEAYDELCARLEHQPDLALASDPPAMFRTWDFGLTPLHFCLAIIATFGSLGLLWAGRRSPLWPAEALAWSLLGGLVRCGLVVPGIFNGAEAGYEKLVIGLGKMQNSPYGDGYRSLMAPLLSIFGENPTGIYNANLLLSSLTVGLVWGWVAVEGGVNAARAAALLWLLLPVPLLLSRSEELSVGVVALGALALLTSSAFRKGAPAFLPVVAAAAVGLALHTRPEAMMLVPVVAVFSVGGPKTWGRGLGLGTAMAVLGTLIVLRLPLGAGGQDVLHPERLLRFEALVQLLTPAFGLTRRGVQQLALHLHYTPPLLPILALLGWWRAPAGSRLRLGVAWACLTLPFVSKCYPLADLLRLQYPALLPWILAAGIGGGLLVERAPRAWAALLIVGTAPWWWHSQPDWVNQQEERWLSAVVPTLPADATVLYPDPQRRSDKFRQIMEDLGPARWSGGGEGRSLLYVGLGCLLPEAVQCRDIRQRCVLTPLRTTELPAVSDLDLDLGAPVTIGFYTLGACGLTDGGATASPASSPDSQSPTSNLPPGADSPPPPASGQNR